MRARSVVISLCDMISARMPYRPASQPAGIRPAAVWLNLKALTTKIRAPCLNTNCSYEAAQMLHLSQCSYSNFSASVRSTSMASKSWVSSTSLLKMHGIFLALKGGRWSVHNRRKDESSSTPIKRTPHSLSRPWTYCRPDQHTKIHS